MSNSSNGLQFTPSEISTYYRDRLPGLKQKGSKWRGPCPWHEDHRAAFLVSPDSGRWHCFGPCGNSGGLIDFEMAHTRTDFVAARASVYSIVGRVAPATGRITKAQWEAMQVAHERAQAERNDAEYFAQPATGLAEEALESLDTTDWERWAHTQLIADLRKDPTAVYREFQGIDPKFAAALVEVGRSSRTQSESALWRLIDGLALAPPEKPTGEILDEARAQ